jgi:hypothetical protein
MYGKMQTKMVFKMLNRVRSKWSNSVIEKCSRNDITIYNYNKQSNNRRSRLLSIHKSSPWRLYRDVHDSQQVIMKHQQIQQLMEMIVMQIQRQEMHH